MKSSATVSGIDAIRKGLQCAPRSRFRRSGASADSQVALHCMSACRHLVLLPIEVWQKTISDALAQVPVPGSVDFDQPGCDNSALPYP